MYYPTKGALPEPKWKAWVVTGPCWAEGARASNSCHSKGPIKRGMLMLHLAVKLASPSPLLYHNSLVRIKAEFW